MNVRTSLERAVRWSWLAIGGAWGTWVGFGGYFGVTRNSDSFASLLASGFFIVFALLGLLAGVALAGAVGWLVEYLLRRLGAGTTVALLIATLASLVALWQISDLILDKYPGLRAPAAVPAADTKALPVNPCTAPAPSDANARQSWEAECR